MGKVVSTACGVPIGGAIDVIKGAVRDITGGEISSCEAASNLAMLSTSNCQFWTPLLDQTRELLALSEGGKDGTSKLSDILSKIGARLAKSSASYLAARVPATHSPFLAMAGPLDTLQPSEVEAALQKLISTDDIIAAANSLEDAQHLLAEVKELEVTEDKSASSAAIASLSHAVKLLYFAGEESRQTRSLRSASGHLVEISSNLSLALESLLNLAPNKAAAKIASNCKASVQLAVRDAVYAAEACTKCVTAISGSDNVSRLVSRELGQLPSYSHRLNQLKDFKLAGTQHCSYESEQATNKPYQSNADRVEGMLVVE